MTKSNRVRSDGGHESSREPMCAEVRSIESAAHYHGAIGEALGRVAARPGTPQAARLCALIVAVEEYEARHGHDIPQQDRLSVSIRRLRVSVGIE